MNVRGALVHSAALALGCLASYMLVTDALADVRSLSHADDVIGGLWAVIATVFVLRTSHDDSISAAKTRATATALSFALCFAYLLFLPFHTWALAALIGAGALALTAIGQPGDAPVAAIPTAVVMVSAALSPNDAWQQPLLRAGDTAVGIVVGLVASWLAGGALFLDHGHFPAHPRDVGDTPSRARGR